MVNCQSDYRILISIVCLITVQNALGLVGSNCSISALGQCAYNEYCDQTSESSPDGKCICLKDYHPGQDKVCVLDPSGKTVPPDPSGPTEPPAPGSLPTYRGSHIAAGILLPIVLASLIGCLIYTARRYHWIQRLRALRQRRYDEVQFGQEDDDPPLA